jgi:hypothetical protein
VPWAKRKFALVVKVPVHTCTTNQRVFIVKLSSLIEIIMHVQKMSDILMLLTLLQETVQ